MYNGRHVNPAAPRKKARPAVFLIVLALLMTLTVGTTIAFLVTHTDPVVNTFAPTDVSCYVDETYDGSTKQDVRIQNTGKTDAYIRAVVVVNWLDSDGNVCAGHTAALPEISSGWTPGSDGFYYYNSAVAPGEYTSNLIDSVSMSTAEDGCRMQVEIVASAVQSTEKAAQNAWGFVPGA